MTVILLIAILRFAILYGTLNEDNFLMSSTFSSAEFVSFLLAFTFGDPHIRTLDGHTYTFNGIGDYILFSIKNSTEFVIHSRMSKARVSQTASMSESKATVFSAFAMTSNQGALVEFYMNVTSMFINAK